MKKLHKALLVAGAGLAVSVAGVASANADSMGIHHVKNEKTATMKTQAADGKTTTKTAKGQCGHGKCGHGKCGH